MKTASKIVTMIAGLLFIVAVCLKIHQILTVPMPTEPLVDTWLFMLIQIPLELGLGIWLLSGLFKKEAWLITLIGYGCFIGVTSWRIATGQESCGCFGTALGEFPPKITLFAIDIPMFLALAIFRPKDEKFLQWPTAKHFILIALPTAIILSSLVPTMIFNKVTDKKPGVTVIGPNEIRPPKTGTEKVKPDDPVDPNVDPGTTIDPNVEPAAEEWKCLKKIDIADKIRKGMNIILLYRDDCDKCHEAMPMFEEYATQFGTGENSIRIAFVQLPPFDEDKPSSIPPDTKCFTGKYNPDENETVFGATPITVITIDGVAVKMWVGTDDIPTFDDLMDAMMAE